MEAIKKVKDLSKQLETAKIELEKELLSLPKVERAVLIIKEFEFPKQLYNCLSGDEHDETYAFKDGLIVSAVSSYGYTDILGITVDELREIKSKIQR